MATKTFTFVCAVHEEFGTKGWKLKSMPHFEPLSGMAIPHDMLEHFADDNGTAADECQALGASLWIRGGHYFSNIKSSRYSPAVNAASDIAELFRKGLAMSVAPRVTRLDKDMEEDLQAMREAFLEDFKSYGNGESEYSMDSLSTYIDNASAWMRKGYKRAMVRYKGIPQYCLADWFYAIEVECDQLLKDADEGQEMVVTLDVRNCHADCSLVEVDYDYADY